MEIIQGIPASPGYAEGPALKLVAQTVEVQRYQAEDPGREIARLDEAIASARVQLQSIYERALQEVGPEEAAVFEAHQLFLDDPDLLGMVRGFIQNEGHNAEAAWFDGSESYAKMLEAMENEYFAARAADVRDVGKRVLRLLMGIPEDDFTMLNSPAIILAKDLTPSDTVRLDKTRVLAFCTAEGGPTSHTAILAKSLGLPAVVGATAKLLDVSSGTPLLVDGERGQVIVQPTGEVRAGFQSRRAQFERRSAEEISAAMEPAVTPDGHAVAVVANIGGADDAQVALKFGAEGVGLFRTEFLYLDRSTAPDEDEQCKAYEAVMDVMGSRPVVVRTMDIGGDKELPYLNLPREANPFLGYRAVRISLSEPDIFKTQLRALLRAAYGHDMRIMFPMIATLDEVRRCKELLDESRRELEMEGTLLPERVQTGIMVEIPSVAVLADLFAREVDFFSVGTNDLTQYTFAAERTNEKVAHLSDPLHPALLRQLKLVIEAAHAQGIWAGLCGEMAGNPDAVPLLLGLGLDEFSMSPSMIPGAKAIIRRWSQAAARELALQALRLDSAEAVRALVHAATPA